MNARERSLSRSEEAIIRHHMEALMAREQEISGVLVSTIDGFRVAACLTGTLSAEKLSAMASSLLAINEAVCQESSVGECRDLVIEASQGRILLMDIPHPAQKLILTVLCRAKVTMGQVLWAARGCRESLGKMFVAS
ncbi:roadblock/LC7 domain-containing protein [Dyella sp. ASV21]|jgi:predicted regulator of Ras-like GTPase activity (Roadblock/LC7/MglB family)|uniref:roadblock/LC7 domain-containing protein n=1 Tax=Dyella sp. ASV21 TaxID=2795114 RepID=UPI0018EC880E|nr:roadblock/LC7 domain-containing protein [Dyella sp. ASV21]